MPSTKPSLWSQIKGTFTKKPDTRPDPEDKTAYDHVAPIETKFKALPKPVQILRDNGKRPTDVQEDATTLALPPAPPGTTYWIDVYEGPRGSGYQVCYEVTRGQKTYRKVINFGPEEEREQDWALVPEPLPMP